MIATALFIHTKCTSSETDFFVLVQSVWALCTLVQTRTSCLCSYPKGPLLCFRHLTQTARSLFLLQWLVQCYILRLQMDLDDPRFASVYDNPHFNIDPSAPEYKATKSMDLLVREKINRRDKKRKRKTVHNSEQRVKVTKVISDFEPSQGDSVANLVNSVKAKAKKLQTRKAKCK